jgi:quercetin dioxygenase-like cupin family protein
MPTDLRPNAIVEAFMNLRIFGAAFLLLLAQGAHALAWHYQGHEVIGSIADQLLEPNAKQQVADLLGFELRLAGPWADCARNVHFVDGTFKYSPATSEFEIPCNKIFEKNPDEKARMEDYVSRNWSNCTFIPDHGCDDTYHFADVAIQHNEYSRSYVGTSNHDIVSAINAAIMVLRDQPPPSPFSIRDKREALLLLVHFVEDLHQPLHVGAIYLDRNGQPVNPEGGLDSETETIGGNRIIDANNNFHSEWDDIPVAFGESASPDMVCAARAVAPTTAPIEGFAEIWASDTVVASHSAFFGLSFSGKLDNGQWEVHFPDRAAYWSLQNLLKYDQLAKGGARLAQLLNAIWPSASSNISLAQSINSTSSDQPLFEDLSQAKWKKMLPDLGDASPEIAILRVDPTTHATQLLIRTPKAIHILKHWHSANETHTMIMGKATFGCEGNKVELGPGGFNYMPARAVHEAWTTPGSVVFITVDGSWDVNWVEGAPGSADLIQ